MYLAILALSIVSYLLGSIPFGHIFAKWNGVNIRQRGSGNIGATNVGRSLGFNWFIVTFAADAAKGFCAVQLLRLLPFEPKVGIYILIGGMAIVGHVFTCWLHFRGGKAVATSFGVLVALLPWGYAVVALGAFLAAFLPSRQVSLGSITAVVAVVIAKFFFGGGLNGESFELTLFVVGVLVLFIITHRENIKRLRSGTENKVNLPRSP